MYDFDEVMAHQKNCGGKGGNMTTTVAFATIWFNITTNDEMTVKKVS